jgi:hypothetical protein
MSDPIEELKDAARETVESLQDRTGLPVNLQRTLDRLEEAVAGVTEAE